MTEKIMEYKLLLGDCLDRLKEIEDCSVDSIVTDPPYHLTSIVKRFGKEDASPAKYGTDGAFQRASKGFMGQEWDGGDIAFRTEVWEECLRVLKPGGHLLAFSGSRTYHRMAYAIDEAGFEIRDQIMWVYGSGFPKSHNIGKAIDKKLGVEREVVGISNDGAGNNDIYIKGESKRSEMSLLAGYNKEIEITKGSSEYEGWGTALKPAHEPIVMARKPLEKKSVADNVLEYGTGAINIDACRVGDNGGSKLKAGIKDEPQSAFKPGEKKNFNHFSDSEYIEGLGRWPANFIHDGSEEVLEHFPDDKRKTDPNKGSTIKSECNAGFQNDYVGGKAENRLEQTHYNDTGSVSRFFYCAKASKTDREENNNHPTVKPTDLMRYLCRLITPKNGTILDPFMGSGSTGKASMLEGFNFIGIELSEEYLDIAEKRIKHVITDIE